MWSWDAWFKNTGLHVGNDGTENKGGHYGKEEAHFSFLFATINSFLSSLTGKSASFL